MDFKFAVFFLCGILMPPCVSKGEFGDLENENKFILHHPFKFVKILFNFGKITFSANPVMLPVITANMIKNGA